MSEKIGVFVVNDSAFMRKFLTDIVNSDADFEILDTARDGQEALRKLERLSPDVVLVDLEMPRMDGITFISEMMSQHPTPSVVVSTYSQEGSQLVFDCLEEGAVDFISLPHEKLDDVSDFKENLLSKIKIASQVSIDILKQDKSLERPEIDTKSSGNENAKTLVVIGASTGGPRITSQILSKLPADFPAGIILVQHMPPGFTETYAKRLDKSTKLQVKIAQDGDLIKQGTVLVAPADYHLMVVPPNFVYLDQSSKRFGVRPSINVSMITGAEVYDSKTIGILLTGMGHDGAFGMKTIKQRNGKTLAQDESTCTVFGMPGAAKEIDAVDKFLTPEQIAQELSKEVLVYA